MNRPDADRSHMCVNPKCGGKIETPGKTGLCYSCWCFAQLPKQYGKWERVMMDHIWSTPGNPQFNATCLPRTGHPALDQKKQILREIILTPSEVKSWSQLEAQQGISDIHIG